jgi:hypothetical protein
VGDEIGRDSNWLISLRTSRLCTNLDVEISNPFEGQNDFHAPRASGEDNGCGVQIGGV